MNRFLKLKPLFIGTGIGAVLFVLIYLVASTHFAFFTLGFYAGIFLLLTIASTS